MREQLLTEVKELNTSAERVEAILRQAQAELRSYVGSILGSLFSRGAISTWRDIFTQTLKHPKLSAKLLQETFEAQPNDYNIAAAIGENPSAPLPLLYQAWAKAPDSFLQNPIVALLQLESPGFWGRLPAETMKALLGLPNIGTNLFEHAIKHYTHDLRVQVAQHPNAPTEIIEVLSESHDERLLSALARHPKLSLKNLERLLGHSSDSVRRAAAENPAWPPTWVSLIQKTREVIYHKNLKVQPSFTNEEFCALARCGDFLKGYLSQHPKTPAPVLTALARSGCNAINERGELPEAWLMSISCVSWRDLATLRNLASHPNASDALLRALSKHHKYQIKKAILERPLLDEKSQLAFSVRTCLNSRTLLSERLDLTEGVLLALSQDQSSTIRANAAANPRMPRQRALEMLYDKRPEIGLTICQKNPDRELLLRLTESQHPAVRDAAWKGLPDPKRPPLDRDQTYSMSEYETFLQRGPYVIQLLTESALTPAWVYAQLAKSPREPERVYVAQSQYAPAEILAALSCDPSLLVRATVAKNPRTPAELITQLALRHELLAQHCAENPALPKEALTALQAKPSRAVLFRLLQNPGLPNETQERLLREAPPGLRRQLAKESAASEILEKILRQAPHLKIKRALSQNPNITQEMRQELQREKDLQVLNHLASQRARP
jgi:hypothetical protein